jgi:hypothetical protein
MRLLDSRVAIAFLEQVRSRPGFDERSIRFIRLAYTFDLIIPSAAPGRGIPTQA